MQRSLLVLLLLAAPILPTQETPDPLCVKAAQIPIPRADQPLNPPRESSCDPVDLYYTGALAKARACAFSYRNQPDPDGEVERLMGNAILAMIFAQGKGVAPNLPLAERFACEMNDWGQSGASVAHTFEDARRKGARTAAFDICKDPLGRQSNFVCISRDSGVAKAEVRSAQARFDTGPPAQRTAFARLIAARKAYQDARSAEEPNGTTGMAQTAIADENGIEHEWAATLNRFAAGKLPNYTAADFSVADASLNTAYKQARASTAGCDGDYCLTSTQLTQIERAWILYREAWVAYAALRWPSTSADAFRTWLTRERTEDLKALSP